MTLLPLTKELLRDRSHELVVYLKFLKIALNNDALVVARGGELTLQIEKSLTHVMKANVCLLLYSAMEACMVQLLDEMHNAIGDNCEGADQLNKRLLLVVARHFKHSKTDPSEENTNVPLQKSLFNAWLTDWKDRTQREKRESGLSGSVDSLAIFKRLSRFGMFPPDVTKPPQHLTHTALKSTKWRRNQLAHGESSFADLGQGLAFEELTQDAIGVFRTLKRIAAEVDTFLLEQRYLANPLPILETIEA